MPIGVNQFKLGAMLSFNPGNSITQMTRVGKAFGALKKSTDRMKTGLLKMSAGFATLRFLPTGFSRAMSGAIKTAMDFEQQMSAVASIAKDAVGPNFDILREKAKELGIVSAFSATAAAEGMEHLARSGFDTKQILTAIRPVLDAAAADSIDLGTSAKIVSDVLRGMGMEVGRASHVANVLAQTSASTSTNITQLGDAFTYAASTARDYKFTINEASAALGWLAMAGLKGSIAGTSFTNMMAKLTRPSAKATKFMDQYKIKLTDAGGKMKDLADIVEMFIKPLDKMNDDAERAGMVAEIFGLRGKKAYSAFSAAGIDSLRSLTTELEASSEGIGAAGRMAQIRLDNLAGAMTLLKSSAQGLAIEVVAGIGLPMKEGVQAITNFVNAMIFAIKGVAEKDMKELFEGMAGTPMILLGTAQAIGRGIRDFFTWFGGAFEKVKTQVAPIISWIENLSEGTKRLIGGIMIALPIIGGLLAPLVFGLGLIVPALGAGFAIITGFIGVIAGALIPIAIPLAGIIFLLSRMKKESESWGSFLLRTFKTVKNAVVGFATSFWNTFQPFATFMKDELIVTFKDLVETMAPAFRRIGDMFGLATGDASTFGSRVGWLLGVVAMVITTVAKFTVFLIKLFTLPVRAVLALGEYIGIGLATAVEFGINLFEKLRATVSAGLSGDFERFKGALSRLVEFIKPIANTVINFLLTPYRVLAGTIADILAFAPVKKSLELLGWDVAGVAAQMASFATKGVALQEGGFLKRDTNAFVHKNELVMPIRKFTDEFMPRVAAETIPATIERIKETTIIQERARALMPEIRPEINVNVPEGAPKEITVHNVIMLDGAAIARAIGNAEITEGLRTGRTRQMAPSEERSVSRTGFRR